jgi:hypothetical protein
MRRPFLAHCVLQDFADLQALQHRDEKKITIDSNA